LYYSLPYYKLAFLQARVYNKFMKLNYSYKIFVGFSYCGPFGSSATFGVVEDGAGCALLEAKDGGMGI
jgi:hypothetical protein